MRQVNKAKFFGWAAAAFVGVGLIAYLGVAIYHTSGSPLGYPRY